MVFTRFMIASFLLGAGLSLGCQGQVIESSEPSESSGSSESGGSSGEGGGGGTTSSEPDSSSSSTTPEPSCESLCDDTNDCTIDTCPVLGCKHEPTAAGSTCTTTDGLAGSCQSGACVVPCGDCDDGNLCTNDYCAQGACQHDPLTYAKPCEVAQEQGYCAAKQCLGTCEGEADGVPCAKPPSTTPGTCTAGVCL